MKTFAGLTLLEVPRSCDSTVKRRYSPTLCADSPNIIALIGNVVYAALFGWVIGAAYMLASAILWISQVGKPYAHLCRTLASYYFWPFGKYVTVEPFLSTQT